jgi:hypothetical protein
MTATCQRRCVRGVTLPAVAEPETAGRSVVTASSQAAGHHVLAQHGDGAVPIGVGHPHGELGIRRGRRGTLLVWLVRHACSLVAPRGLALHGPLI